MQKLKFNRKRSNKIKSNKISLNLDFKHNIHELEDLTKNPNITSRLTGAYLSKFKGQGIEFEEYKEYIYGEDDANKIDWVASNKTTSLLVKKFKTQRSTNVIIALDTSKSMFFSSSNKLKCEYAAELAASLSFAIIESKDNVGLAIFNKGIKKFIPPANSLDHYFKLLNELQNEDNYFYEKDYIQTFKKLGEMIVEKDVLLFIISDFSQLHKEQLEYLDILCAGFDITGFLIKDPVEENLPKKGLYSLNDPFSSSHILIDSQKIKDLYHKEYRKNIFRLKNHFLEKENDLVEISMSKDSESQIMEYFIAQK